LADDGTLAPDDFRLARAARAGLRPGSAWLTPALLCLALALALELAGPSVLADWRALWSAGFAGAPTAPLAWLTDVLARLLGLAAGVALAGAAVTGALGWVDPDAGRGLHVGPLRSRVRGLLACAVPLLAAALLAGVCAGAARAVDAGEAGLLALWAAWLRRLLFGTGALLLLAALVDRAVARHRLWRALHRTPAELRAGPEGE
jgi:hypothetical protein